MNSVKAITFVFLAAIFVAEIQMNAAASNSLMEMLSMMDDAENNLKYPKGMMDDAEKDFKYPKGMMDDAEKDFKYPKGCRNVLSLRFCRRVKRFCTPSNRNFNFMKTNCKFTCGVCHY